MSDFQFFVDIAQTNVFFDALGSGPLESATTWRYTARADRAGQFELEMAASDPLASLVTNGRAVRAGALLGGAWVEVGIGIVQNIETVPGANGRATLHVSGLDIIGELNYRNVRALEIGVGTGATHAEALTILNGYAPTGWVFQSAALPGNDYLYAKYDGESVLGAIIYLAEKTQTHFYRGIFRNLIFVTDFEDSGVRAIQATGDLPIQACAITGLRRTIDTHDLLTRIYPYGSGEDRETSVTLAATSRSAPPGFVLDKVNNYIENTPASGYYGLRDYPYVEYKDITPISNTNADWVAAADMLFDSALAELQRRLDISAQTTYDLSVAQCSQLLRPMQTIRLVYRDPDQNIDIDEDVYILEATWEMDRSGIRTSHLVVSTQARWPVSAGDNAADRAVQGRIFQAHQQISLNEWWGYASLIVGDDQTNHIGEMPFVLGESVVTIKRVVFRFKLEQVLAGANSYAYAGAATTTGPSSATATAAINKASSPNTGDSPPATSGLTGSTTVTGAINKASSPYTGDSPPSTSGLTGSTTVTGAVNTTTTAGINKASNPYTGDSPPDTGAVDGTTSTGNNSVVGDPHTHVFGHIHSALHQHDMSHTHNMPHTHNNTDHLHTMLHAHDMSHTHNNTDHLHSMLHAHDMAHDHNMPHNHTIPALVRTFGLVRADPSLTYAMSDLEYSVNGGTWVSLDSATDVSGGYWELDITVDVTDPVIPFRPAQTSGNNIVQIRRKTAAGTGKTAMILAMLGVRTTIQGVAIS